MYTGTPEELRRKENEAAHLAVQIAALLTEVEALGVSQVMPRQGAISGPGFTIRRIGNRWSVHR